MLAPSFRVVPLLRETEPRSDPARSTSVSLPSWCSSSMPLARVARRSEIWSTACERDEAAFADVSETARRALPRSSISKTSSAREGSCSERPQTEMPFFGSARSWRPPGRGFSPGAGLASRSRMFSLYTSKYESRIAKVWSTSAWLIALKSASIAIGMTPGPVAALPSIVCVLPEPVAP